MKLWKNYLTNFNVKLQFAKNNKKQSIIIIALFVMKRNIKYKKNVMMAGLSRCSTISSKENFLSGIKKYLSDELKNRYNAAKGLILC